MAAALEAPLLGRSRQLQSGALRPLRIAPFRRLAGAYAISHLGDTLALVALAIVVYDRTDSTVAVMALFLARELLPAVAAPVLTARLDRAPTRRVLPAIFALEGAVFVVLAVAVDSLPLGLFLAVVAAEAGFGLAAGALCRGAVGAVLEPTGELRTGNALLNMAIAPNMAIGGALGAALVAGVGVEVALLVNAATFGLGAALVATARGLPRHEVEVGEAEHWRERLTEGLAYLRRNRVALVLIVGEGAAMAFFALTEPIEVAYARDSLHSGAAGYGALISAWGIGVMLGSLLHAWVGHLRLRLAMLLSVSVMGAAYLALGAAPDIETACAIAVAGGAGNGVQMVAVATAIQEAIAREFQARVLSLHEALITATPGLGYLLGGVVGATVGARAAFVVAGVGVLATVAVVLLAWPRRGRYSSSSYSDSAATSRPPAPQSFTSR